MGEKKSHQQFGGPWPRDPPPLWLRQIITTDAAISCMYLQQRVSHSPAKIGRSSGTESAIVVLQSHEYSVSWVCECVLGQYCTIVFT